MEVPAELVVRRSCGCLPGAVLQIPVEAHAAVIEQPIPPFTDVPAPMWEAFLTGVQEQSTEDFLFLLDQALREARDTEGSLAAWQRLLTEMRRHTLTHLGDPAARHRAEDLLQQARLLVGDAERHQEAYRRQLFEQQEALLGQIDTTLSTTLHLDELVPALNGLFPRIGIECCLCRCIAKRDLAERARLHSIWHYSPGATPEVELHQGPWFAPTQLVPEILRGASPTVIMLP